MINMEIAQLYLNSKSKGGLGSLSTFQIDKERVSALAFFFFLFVEPLRLALVELLSPESEPCMEQEKYFITRIKTKILKFCF